MNIMKNKIINWTRELFLGPFNLFTNNDDFEYSPEGFVKARNWAKDKPHPKFPDDPHYSLWDYVNNNWIDSEYKLSEINKIKTNKNKN